MYVLTLPVGPFELTDDSTKVQFALPEPSLIVETVIPPPSLMTITKVLPTVGKEAFIVVVSPPTTVVPEVIVPDPTVLMQPVNVVDVTPVYVNVEVPTLIVPESGNPIVETTFSVVPEE